MNPKKEGFGSGSGLSGVNGCAFPIVVKADVGVFSRGVIVCGHRQKSYTKFFLQPLDGQRWLTKRVTNIEAGTLLS
jgi:hypothetical protein